MKHTFSILKVVIIITAISCRALPAANQPGIIVPWGGAGSPYWQFPAPGSPTNVVDLAVAADFTLGLLSDGTVLCWGPFPPDLPTGLSNVVSIDANADHCLALRSDGTVTGWGFYYDMTGHDIATSIPPGISGALAIASGQYHMLILTSNHTVVAWGGSTGGYYGETNVPAGLSNVVAISARDYYSLALKGDGTVTAWGYNASGATSVPTDLSNVTAIAAGGVHAMALKSDGTVTVWGGDASLVPPAGLNGVIAVAAGEGHCMALRNDGTVTIWGDQTFVPAGLTNVIGIKAGTYSCLALSTMQKPVIVSLAQYSTTYQAVPITLPGDAGVNNFPAVTVVASGYGPLTYQWQKDGADLPGETNATFALPFDAQADSAGDYDVVVGNSGGSVTSPILTYEISPFLNITADPQPQTAYVGNSPVFSVSAQGSMPFSFQWMKDGADVAGATGSTLVLTNVQTSDKGLYSVVVSNAAGSETSASASLTVNPTTAPVITSQPGSATIFVGAKMIFSVGVTGATPFNYQWFKNGSVVSNQTGPSLEIDQAQYSDAAGYSVVVSNSVNNATSQVAILAIVPTPVFANSKPGTVVSAGGPILPSDLTNVVAISAGSTRAAALRSDGTVTAWSSQPPLPPNNVISNAVEVSVGANFFGYALLNDGTVVPVNQVDKAPPTGLFGVIAISAGGHSVLALKADGTVTSWGTLVPPVPSGLSNVIAISAGNFQNLALKSDGTVATWSLGTGVALNPASNVVAVAAGQNFLALQSDGSVTDLSSSQSGGVPAGLTDIVALSTGYGQSLALKLDGTVTGWGNATVPAGLTNVSAIAAGNMFSLFLTTNPPAPLLSSAVSENALKVRARTAVSGYVLETTDDLSKPFTPVTVTANMIDLTDTNNPAITLPTAGAQKYYRMKKLP